MKKKLLKLHIVIVNFLLAFGMMLSLVPLAVGGTNVSKTLQAGGRYFSDISTSSPAGLAPGDYEVTSIDNVMGDIDACDFNNSNGDTENCSSFEVGGDANRIAHIAVRSHQRIAVRGGSSVWKLIKSAGSSGSMVPGDVIVRRSNTKYYSTITPSASSGISPGLYLVSGGDIETDVEAEPYDIGTGSTSFGRYYSVTDEDGYAIVQVNAGERVSVHSGSGTKWQLLKRFSNSSFLTPSATAQIHTATGKYYSNIVPSSPAGIAPGIYLVTTASQYLSSDITVNDYNYSTNTIYKSRTYTSNSIGESALIQVNPGDMVTSGSYSVKSSWRLLKAIPPRDVHYPGPTKNIGLGTYGTSIISPGLYLVNGVGDSTDISVCDYDHLLNETQNCKKYIAEESDSYSEVSVNDGQQIVISLGYDYSTGISTVWRKLTTTNPGTQLQVGFDSQGGSKVPTTSIAQGRTLSRPSNPTRTGYSFSGWTTDRLGKYPFNFSTKITKGFTLYAQWKPNAYKVTFNINGGNGKIDSRVVKYGSPYGPLPTVTRKNYIFIGWFDSNTNGNRIASTTRVSIARDHTLYARWSVDAPVPVYRIYNPNSGLHHYSVDVQEKNKLVSLGWRDEGISFKAVKANSENSIPVYREYNPFDGNHNWTVNEKEHDGLIRVGWKNEGVAWYVKSNGQIKVYRLYNPNSGEHVYTTSLNEYNAVIKSGWRGEGVAWNGVK